MYSTKRTEHWVVVAAQEFHRIQTRWGLSSRRETAQLLRVNARTLAKLNPENPDPTLSVESVIRIYNTLLLLVDYEFPPSRQEEVRQFIIVSMLRVQACIAPPSQLLLRDLQALDAGRQSPAPIPRTL